MNRAGKWLKFLLWRLFGKFPDWKRRGRFEGVVGLDWLGPRDYHFRNDGGFKFLRGLAPDAFRPSGEEIVPGEMRTDGGTIPRIAWILPNLNPWSGMPAYLIHDWLFQTHHDGTAPELDFDTANLILMEALYTMVCDKTVEFSGFDLRLIYDGVSSPVGREIWDKGSVK